MRAIRIKQVRSREGETQANKMSTMNLLSTSFICLCCQPHIHYDVWNILSRPDIRFFSHVWHLSVSADREPFISAPGCSTDLALITCLNRFPLPADPRHFSASLAMMEILLLNPSLGSFAVVHSASQNLSCGICRAEPMIMFSSACKLT